jgi:probable F420-dependent oxidoreductase
MRIGAVFPQYEIGNDPATIARWARTVEELGFQHILAYDHVLGAGTTNRPGWRGYTDDNAFHEVFVLFGYLAAITTSVELVTGVLILPQRQTALVAKQAAEVDVLSQGRLRLGIGVGWNAVEYDVLKEDFTDRGVRSAEQIRVLRALWADPTITFTGNWHAVDDAGINPRPERGDIPVWIGGVAEPVLRRIGELADGWFPQRPPDETAAGMIARIHDYARAAGRSPADIGMETKLNLSDPREGWGEFVAGWDKLGATHLTINTMGMQLDSVDEHLDALREGLDIVRATGIE